MQFDLGKLHEGIAVWRRALNNVSEISARWDVFENAAREVAGFTVKGLEIPAAADALAELALECSLIDAGRVQDITARAIENVEHVPDPPKGNGHDHAPAPIEPLPYVDLAAPLVEREWLVAGRIPMFNVTLLSGEGAIGKSIILMQLSVAVVLAKDWLGTLPQQGRVLYVAAEEDEDEIRRRLDAIATHGAFSSTREELVKENLRILSFAGANALLAEPDRNELIRPTRLFERIKTDAIELKPKLIVIDPVADTFGGKENDRAQTRMFCTLMRGLAIAGSAAVILSSHPSIAGIQSDTGLSGSTAWHNSVRARMYFKKAEKGAERNTRVLEVKKNNYGSGDQQLITVRWDNGLYKMVAQQSNLERLSKEQRVDRQFLKLLRMLTEQGRNVSHNAGKTYAPVVFADLPKGQNDGFDKIDFKDSMERLFAAKRVVVVTDGPRSKQRTRLVEVDASNDPSNALPTTSNDLFDDGVGNGNGDENDATESLDNRPSNAISNDFSPIDSIDEKRVPSIPPIPPTRTAGEADLSGDAIARPGGRPGNPGRRPAGSAREALEDSGVGSEDVEEVTKDRVGLHVVGPEPPETTCRYCGKSNGQVYLIRDNFAGVRSEPLHEHCALSYFEGLKK